MRVTQIMLRKRKMHHKPQSFVRNNYWNNHYYLNQERPVRNLKFMETMEEKGIPVMKIDDVLSPFLPSPPSFQFTEPVRKKELTRDQDHPLWNDLPAYTYRDRSWLPCDQELKFAAAATNTVALDSLPHDVVGSSNNVSVDDSAAARVTRLLQNCYFGDAVQDKLPRNFEVPFTGWHPVESRMNPRNQYDWKAMSWGWKEKREYGVPNKRKIVNLNRGLFKEVCKNSGVDVQKYELIENTKIRQFITAPDGKLIRYWLSLPLLLTSRTPLAPLSAPSPSSSPSLSSSEQLSVPDTSPVDPFAGFFQEYIYENENNFPITSSKFSHPHVHTVFYHNTSHIRPRYKLDKERSKCLLHSYAVALGQARLLQGEKVVGGGKLKSPIRINSVSTNGQKFVFSTFQLNSLDLDSSTPNYFYSSPDEMQLFEECGMREGAPVLQGVNMEVFKMLQTMLMQ